MTVEPMNSGRIDGKFGKGTLAAISVYPKSRNYPLQFFLPDGLTLTAIFQEVNGSGLSR